ncbi:2OG-Fe(II) oxygenase superfamily protein [Seiridium cupressi]
MSSAVSKSSFYLPLVDITPFLEDPRSPAAQQVIDDVRRACQSTGFFQIKGHGISPKLHKAVFEASAKFFALPGEEKMKLDAQRMVGFRGYNAMATQSYESGAESGKDVVRDLKEGFFASTDLPLTHPLVTSGRFLQGPNVWPEAEHLAPEEFRVIVEEYHGEMLRLSHVVLDLIAATLPYGPHVFDEFKGGDLMCLLRLLHYPPDPPTAEDEAHKKQFGSGEHMDFSLLTLLAQDEHPGLEVLDTETGDWVVVPPQDGVYIVNMADIMSMITGGDYKSSVHRVWNKNTEERYSIVFFFDGNLDYKLRRLDGHEQPGIADKDVPTVEGHVRRRMTGSYNTSKQ